MRIKPGLVFLVWCLPAITSSGSPFVTFGFNDPYGVIFGLRTADSTGLGANSYWGQLDSMGINMSVSRVDMNTTNNAYGIKIIGQDLIQVSSGKFRDFSVLVHIAHNIYAEAENTDNATESWWIHGPGSQALIDNDSAWLCRSGIHEAGTALLSQGIKFRLKYTRSGELPTYLRFRMAAWDTLTTDILLTISV